MRVFIYLNMFKFQHQSHIWATVKGRICVFITMYVGEAAYMSQLKKTEESKVEEQI